MNITERGIPSFAAINPTTPHITAYIDTACTIAHIALKPIKRIIALYKPNLIKISEAITGALKIATNKLKSSGQYH
jgi:hypothetical protein